jgi:hypothetical protein
MGCWRVPEVREKFKDKRIVPRNAINVEHWKILNNPVFTEPNKLFFLAYRIMKKYGERIQIDDLKQIGWVVMIKGVSEYNPLWNTSLFRYCKRGISSEMHRHCVNELRSSTMGVTHEDFIDYIANDYIHSQLKGGLSRYTLGQTFGVTNHALAKYRERFNANGTRKELRRIVEYSQRLPLEREELWLNNSEGGNEVREYDECILIMGPTLHLWSKQQQLITVMHRSKPF